VVDDEQSIQRLCRTIGNTLGYAALEAERGGSAGGLVRYSDLLLTDLKLPNLSGVESEADEVLLPIPIAIMTGQRLDRIRMDANELWASD